MTGNPLLDVFVAAGIVAGGLTLVGMTGRALRRVLRSLMQLARKADEFLDDWRGVEGRPGVEGRAGVMARLARIEGELQPNGGGSFRDRVNGMADDVTQVKNDLAAHLAEHRQAPMTIVNTNVAPPQDGGGHADDRGESPR